MVKLCTVKGCEDVPRALGLCDKHYQRKRTHGDPNIVLKRGRPKQSLRDCSLDDCKGTVVAKNLCWKHYQKQRRYGDPRHERTLLNDRECSVEDCNVHAISRGWCQRHYCRFLRHGDPTISLHQKDRKWKNIGLREDVVKRIDALGYKTRTEAVEYLLHLVP